MRNRQRLGRNPLLRQRLQHGLKRRLLARDDSVVGSVHRGDGNFITVRLDGFDNARCVCEDCRHRSILRKHAHQLPTFGDET